MIILKEFFVVKKLINKLIIINSHCIIVFGNILNFKLKFTDIFVSIKRLSKLKRILNGNNI